jgi:hypothetical protein
MSRELTALAYLGVATELVAPLAVAVTVAQGAGPVVSVVGIKGDIAVVLHAALATAGTTPTLDVSVYESADGSTGWALVKAFTRVTDAAAGGVQVMALDSNPRKGFLTAKVAVAGSGAHFPIAAHILTLPPA